MHNYKQSLSAEYSTCPYRSNTSNMEQSSFSDFAMLLTYILSYTKC